MLRDDGTVAPHRRLSAGDRKTGSVVVWCGTGEAVERAQSSAAPTRDDGGRSA
jgi:hypothetical protein